jgi:protein tyrosine/serine phosphatase
MKRKLITRSLLVLGLLATLFFSVASHRGLPPTDGILNFGKVNEVLYRGAQPDGPAIIKLKQLGIKTIIDLQMPNGVRKAEAAEALASGINYTNVPLHGLGRPTDAQIKQLLAIIETAPSPIFIHCQHGCDRTGTIVACYRIEHDQWTGENALKEADHYGMSWLERGMRHYVMDFARSTPKK